MEFAANQAGLFVGCLAYNLLHTIRDAAFRGESVKPSIESIMRRLVKVGPRWSIMPGNGTFTLRRLFPSPVTIISYSPDARPTRCGANLRSIALANAFRAFLGTKAFLQEAAISPIGENLGSALDLVRKGVVDSLLV